MTYRYIYFCLGKWFVRRAHIQYHGVLSLLCFPRGHAHITPLCSHHASIPGTVVKLNQQPNVALFIPRGCVQSTMTYPYQSLMTLYLPIHNIYLIHHHLTLKSPLSCEYLRHVLSYGNAFPSPFVPWKTQKASQKYGQQLQLPFVSLNMLQKVTDTFSKVLVNKGRINSTAKLCK